ncbi:hypothetical protein OIU84_005169 [Salix udensis]|uniref:S-adenosyl-L-methionine-dependent methyltransferase superfamily protein n=1 Tax=Salix udensis TaxID=889485 RepID=A0AAD6JVK7_9ROSI|nr:hypothetical protein OIU84_005169 [Salix udensis]
MGSVSLKIGDGTARFRRASFCSSAVNILMLFSVVTTNLFALYAFSSSAKDHQDHLIHNPHKNISLISEHVSLILREIASSQKKLAKMEKELLGYETMDISRPNIASELKLFLQHHQLPLEGDALPSLFPKVGLYRFPVSLWKPVSEKILTWSGLGCKNLECLNKKKLSRDCAGCFNITSGYETQKFVKARGKNDFLIDDVLALASGGIRIGFDISGGEFIAARGLFPLYLSLDHRFPFYDNVFDLIHASSGLDGGDRPEKLEFLMFDIDRTLRAGGLFWLDNFCCADEEKKTALTRLIERFGYKKLKWVVGEKVETAGSSKSEVYLSAVLQKPARV